MRLTVALLLCGLPLLRPAPLRAEESPAAPEVRTEGIDDLPMPPTVEAAAQELSRNSEQIDRLQTAIRDLTNKIADEKDRYEAARKSLEAALRGLAQRPARCPLTRDEEVAHRRLFDEARQALKDLYSVVRGDPRVYAARIEDDVKAVCDSQATMHFLSDENIKATLDDLAEMRQRREKGQQQQIEDMRRLKEARVRLRDRLQAESARLKSQGDKALNFASDLKWLVLILGALSVAVMLIIRTFPEELQIEWVASGQVIQFMTVLIILIAILALGITGVLKENTLGTLLGGIGGYVLSQGIGRAAGRSAAKLVVSREGQPPMPPAHP